MKKFFSKKQLSRARVIAGSLLALLFGTYSILHSHDSFTALHSGASYVSVDGRRYAPVLSKSLILALVFGALLYWAIVATKWKLIIVIGLGLALSALLGLFHYWALNYTRQPIAEGFITLFVMIASIAAFIGGAYLIEQLTRKKRRKQ